MGAADSCPHLILKVMVTAGHGDWPETLSSELLEEPAPLW
jgi:hypothetical protein